MVSNEEVHSRAFSFDKFGKKINFKAPYCFLYTKAGSIPHLTNETLSYLDTKLLNSATVYEIPVPTVVDFKETFQVFDGECAEFFCLKSPCLTYCSLKDPLQQTSKGYNKNKSVAVWGIGGKKDINPFSHMDLLESMKPDIFDCLNDNDVMFSDSKKRTIKSVDRSLKFLEDAISIHNTSKLLKNSKMVCTIQGNFLVNECKRFCEGLKNLTKDYSEKIFAYKLDFSNMNNEQAKVMLECVKENLGTSKPFFAVGVDNPLSVLDYLKESVYFFESSYISNLASKNMALCYNLIDEDLIFSKDSKNNEKGITSFKDTMDLSDLKYEKCFKPLMVGCECYTCRHHTCAYIHHLVQVNEMLAPVLLTIHNLHHHLTFFKMVQNFLEKNVEIDAIKAALIEINTY